MDKEEKEELERIEKYLNDLSFKYDCFFDIEITENNCIDNLKPYYIHKLTAEIPQRRIF